MPVFFAATLEGLAGLDPRVDGSNFPAMFLLEGAIGVPVVAEGFDPGNAELTRSEKSRSEF